MRMIQFCSQKSLIIENFSESGKVSIEKRCQREKNVLVSRIINAKKQKSKKSTLSETVIGSFCLKCCSSI